MKNIFDADNVPDKEPAVLRIGSFWTWTRTDITGAYPSADYTLHYTFYNMDDKSSFHIQATTNADDDHLIEVSASDTRQYTDGNYQWTNRIVRNSDSEEVLLETGDVVIESETPEQTYNYRVLLAIRAVLEKTASKEQQQYSIAGRQLIRRDTGELLRLEREFQRRVEAERRARLRKLGRKAGNRTLARFDA